MIAGTIYVRVVSADKNRGWVLLVGYDNKVVQRTAIQQVSLSAVTRTSLTASIERVRLSYSATTVTDVTEEGIKRKLAKEFGEEVKKTEKANKAQ
jgi:hypothetical protein